MKTLRLIILLIVSVIGLLALTFFLTKDTIVDQQQQTTTVYVNDLRAQNEAIDSVKGIYQMEIDRIKKSKTVYVTKLVLDRHIADSLEAVADTICIKPLQAKNAVIRDLDSLCNELDMEAQLYSMQLDLTQKQRYNDSIILSDYKQRLYKADSLYIFTDKRLKKQKQLTKIISIIGGAFAITAIVK